MSNLTVLETAVMQKFLAGDDDSLRILRQQLESVSTINREFTGIGFFCDFETIGDIKPVPGNPTLTLEDVGAEINGLHFGAGFILYIKNGCLAQLEGFSYGTQQWPGTIERFRVGYIFGGKLGIERDIEGLRREIISSQT